MMAIGRGDLPNGPGMIVYANGARSSGYARNGCLWEDQVNYGNLLFFFVKTESQCRAEKK